MINENVQVNTPIIRRTNNQPVKRISRPARIVPTGVLKVSTIMDECLEDMRLKQNVLGTQKKLMDTKECVKCDLGSADLGGAQNKMN